MMVEIPVSAEIMARAEKLAEMKGTTAEEEIRWAVVLGLENHMTRNLSVIESWEEMRKNDPGR